MFEFIEDRMAPILRQHDQTTDPGSVARTRDGGGGLAAPGIDPVGHRRSAEEHNRRPAERDDNKVGEASSHPKLR